MNREIQQMTADLERHREVCRELLGIVEQESQNLRGNGQAVSPLLYERKKALLPGLKDSVDTLRTHRVRWHQLSPEERRQHSHFLRLVRQCQELVMRIINLDRENEQGLLRRGLVPPDHLPSAHRQKPHYVANLYQRNGQR